MKRSNIISLLFIFSLIALSAGCAADGQVREDQFPTAPPVITDLNVKDSIIEITASTPFIYTIYKPSEKNITVDIPEVLRGRFSELSFPDNPSVSMVTVSQTDSTRLTATISIILQSPADVEPSYSNNVLTLHIVKKEAKAESSSKQTDDGTQAAPAGTAAVPAKAEEPKEAPVSKEAEAAELKISELTKGDDAETHAGPVQEAKEATDLPKATEINDISFVHSDGIVKVMIKGNGSLNPMVFSLKDRIVIDIPDVSFKANIPSEMMSPVKGLRAGRHKDKIRLVVDLKETRKFDVHSVRDSLVVVIQSPETLIVTAKNEVIQVQKKADAPLVEKKPEPEVKKPEPKVKAPVKKKKSAEAKVEPKVEVKEEPKVEAKVEAKVETKAEPKIEPKIEPKAPNEAIETKEPIALVEGRYTGKKVNLDFQDADVLPILRLLADISGYNIIVNPEVKGKLTMKLINVPWDQALDLILNTFALDKDIEGNIIRIAPFSVFAKERDERAKSKEAVPLETRIFPVNYADVSLIENTVKGSKILTPRGNLSVDKRTSTMVVKDVPATFPQIENLLATLDRPTPQVMIEARIVEVNSSAVKDIGVQWGFTLNTANTLATLGGLSGLNTGSFTGGNYLVDFPSGASAGSGSGFSFGIMNPAKTLGLDMQISALETIGKGKIVSNPRIMTVDNGKALISQGDSIPIRKLNADGTISTEFKDYTLSLEVVPHITPDSSIALDIKTKKEDPDYTKLSSEGTPASKKREANTNVIIKDGETVVIGGVFKTNFQDSDSGVPALKDIPILGYLFKSTKKNEDTSELLIFVTPRIVRNK